jgi:hypothetical protein
MWRDHGASRASYRRNLRGNVDAAGKTQIGLQYVNLS